MTEAPEGGAQVIDLMEALRASLEKKAPARAASAPAPAAAEPEAAKRKPPKRAQPAEAAVPAPRKTVKGKG